MFFFWFKAIIVVAGFILALINLVGYYTKRDKRKLTRAVISFLFTWIVLIIINTIQVTLYHK